MKRAWEWFLDIGWLGRIFAVLVGMTIVWSFLKSPFEYLLGIFFMGLIVFVVASFAPRLTWHTYSSASCLERLRLQP